MNQLNDHWVLLLILFCDTLNEDKSLDYKGGDEGSWRKESRLRLLKLSKR
ncbi:hypothetical protein B0G66_10485 [Bacillus badius]|nr:hypothetical protein B0G66_10485 [Bacillus badius]